MGKLSKLDRAITTIQFIMKQRKARLEEMQKRLDLNENQRVFIGQEIEMMQAVDVLVNQSTQRVHEALGKLPPQAPDLEEAVLGAMMLEKEAIAGVLAVKCPLRKQHFYYEGNAIIFEAIEQLIIAAKPVDMRTVVAQLRKTGNLDKIKTVDTGQNGAYRIAELTSKVSSAANIEYHAKLVIEMAMKRELILAASMIIHDGYEETTDVFEMLQIAEERIKTINTWLEDDQKPTT